MDDLEKIIAIDIDGTLCTISENYEECKLLDNAKESIDYIRSKGYKVFLHTGRHILNSEVTIKWLKQNDINYDHIVFGKPPAKYYIDDKGISFDSWVNVLKNIDL